MFYLLLLILLINECRGSQSFTVPILAPLSKIENDTISKNKVALGYMTAIFSMCHLFEKCRGSLPVVKVVYFWPGDRVEIRCAFCSANAMKSKNMKAWRYMNLTDAFGFNGADTGRQEKWEFKKGTSDKWMTVKDYESTHMVTLHKNSLWPMFLTEDRPKPKYFQKDGKLIITHPGLENQGAYYCYDVNVKDETKIEVTYLLVAMAPLSLINCLHIHAFDAEKDRPSKQEDPAFKNSYMTSEQAYSYCRPTLSKKFDYAIQHDVQPNMVWRHEHMPVHATADVMTEQSLLRDTNLLVDLQWTNWTSCSACLPYQGWKHREGHCHVRKSMPLEPLLILESYTFPRHRVRPLCCQNQKWRTDESRVDASSDENIKVDGLTPLSFLNDLLSPEAPFADGFRLDSALIVSLLCTERPGFVTYYRCLYNWFQFVFNHMRVIHGDKVKPKTTSPFRGDPQYQDFQRQVMACFSFRHLQKFDSVDISASTYKSTLYDAQMGYYIETQPCLQLCPGFNEKNSPM